MPQLYNNAVITDAGLSLLDKVQAGTASVQFTRMAAGDGTYTANEKTSSALKRCTGLKAQRNSYPLSSVSTAPGGGVRLTALITNRDPATGATLVSEGYHINEIGLFAKEKGGADSTEVLYSITVSRGDTGDYMPPYENGAPVQIVQEYHAKVGNAAEVAISCTGAVMLAEDAQREFGGLKKMIGEAGAIDDKTVTFEEAKDRENIASGEKLKTILGKAKKIFASLRNVAFTASYNDLIDKPDIPSIPSSLPASNVTSAYSPAGTAPANGIAIKGALETLDVASKGGAGKYIQSISETDGKISAVEATMPTIPTSLPANGGNASTIGNKDISYIMDYDNLTNRPQLFSGDYNDLTNKPAAIRTVNVVLNASGWTSTEAPFSQTVTISGVTASSNVIMDVQSNISSEQFDAFIDAKMAEGGQSNNSVTIKAFGEKPGADIPVRFMIL